MHILKNALYALGMAMLMTFLFAGGWFNLLYRADSSLNDSFYQQGEAVSPNLVVVGIDDRSIEMLGPYENWGREIMAMAIDALSHEGNRAAVIGLDVIYAAESANPDADAFLAQMAEAHGNVVAARGFEFGNQFLLDDEGEGYIDDFAILAELEPYPALAAVTRQGHVNSMLDADGILRHALYYVKTPDEEYVPSFHQSVAKAYREAMGQDWAGDPPTDERGFWYLPFSNKPGTYYDGISIFDLVTGQAPEGYFQDKIVLIGPYTIGMRDSFSTANSHAEAMYGVEYQGNAVLALLRGDFKAEIPNTPQAIALFTIVFAAAFFLRKRHILPATLLWMALAGGWVAFCALAYAQLGWVLHLLWVPASVTVVYIVAVAVNYMQAAQEKSAVTKTFARYVAPEIVQEILRQGADHVDMAGHTRDIAVLFVDIRGFTPMSELLEPPQVVEILNDYLTLTSGCIMRNHGTLDKFIGDATMAFWGAPLPQEDYIFHAAKAALDMVEGAKALSQGLQEKYGRSVDFGVGVHCGKAVVGNIGAPMRMDYTAIGDTVNTAARLESNAPKGTVYISRAIADALEGRIRVTSLGDGIKLKGKSEGFEILTLDGLAE